jgi:hypothetical protein
MAQWIQKAAAPAGLAAMHEGSFLQAAQGSGSGQLAGRGDPCEGRPGAGEPQPLKTPSLVLVTGGAGKQGTAPAETCGLPVPYCTRVGHAQHQQAAYKAGA